MVGGTRLLLSVIVGRFAGRESLGELTALLSVPTFLVLLWPQALGAAASRRIAAARARSDLVDERRSASYVALAAATTGSALGGIAAAWTLLALSMSWTAAASCGLLTLSLSAYAAVRGIRNGRMELPAAALWDVSGSLLALVLMITLRHSQNAAVLMMPMAVPYLVGAIAGWPAPTRSPGRSARREIRRFSMWTSVQVVANGGMLPLLTIIAAATMSGSDLGDLGAAMSIATPTVIFSIALRTSLAPFVARELALGDERTAAANVDRAFKGLVALLVPAFVLLTFWSHDVMHLIYTDEFGSSYGVLSILLMGTCLQAVNASPIWFMSSAEGARPLGLSYALGLVVAVVVAVPASTVLGSAGTALAFLVGSLVAVSLTTVRAWRETGMLWTPVLVLLVAGLATMGLGAYSIAEASSLLKVVATMTFLLVWCLTARRHFFIAKG